MRSGIRKKKGEQIREFDARQIELISYLKEFPDWEEGKGFDEEEEKEMTEKESNSQLLAQKLYIC